MAIIFIEKGSSKALSKNFKAREFDCKCAACEQTAVDEKLVEYLQKIRDHFGVPVTITSGYRCPLHNAEVGGAAKSKHCDGCATDIKVKGVEPATLAAFAESIGILGIGLYDTDEDGHFVHIDVRTEKSFWFGHQQLARSTFSASLSALSDFSITLRCLCVGCEGEAVEVLQRLLLAYGYNCGVHGIDGKLGTATDKALREFQEDHDLPVTGIADETTMRCLLGVYDDE